jgi:hypothetical protein
MHHELCDVIFPPAFRLLSPRGFYIKTCGRWESSEESERVAEFAVSIRAETE